MGDATVVSDAARLRPALARLAKVPEKVSVLRVWDALVPDERAASVHALLRVGSADDHRAIVAWIARQRSFRPQTIATWSPDKVAQTARLARAPSLSLARNLLACLHLEERREMLRAFLDDLGIAHEDGVVTNEAEPPDLTPGDIQSSAARLLDRFQFDAVVAYALVMLCNRDAWPPGLSPWLRSLGRRTQGTAEAVDARPVGSAGDEPPQVEDPGDDAAPAEALGAPDEFTTLDRRVVRVIIDAAQGIEGAADADELDDLIDELVQLNGSRHRTYFHAGLRDAVLGREPGQRLPAQNKPRRRWYWAGHIQGLAREERWDDIARLFDQHPAVAGLGDDGRGASDAAAPHVFTALCQTDRSGDAAGFLRVEALVSSPGLMAAMHAQGLDMLGRDRLAEARLFFDKLGAAVEMLEAEGHDTSRRFFLEIRRRRAHCYRRSGEAVLARRLLERLLREESDPTIRSMVLADLGLIDSGFRRLADLRLPGATDAVAAFRAALERGEPRFRESIAVGAKYGAHAHYCLGVLGLVREEYEAAAADLELALSVFEAHSQRYSQGGLLAAARLYLGLAICQALETTRMERAAELIHGAVSKQVEVPSYIVADTLQALSLRGDRLARDAAEAILEATGPALLDELVDSGVVRDSEVVVSALLRRARDASRGETERTRDYYKVVPLLLSQQRSEEAGEALDFLEAVALQGIERKEFLALIARPEGCEPAWNPGDVLWARVRCLEAAGQYEQAAQLLHDEFHRVLAAGNGHGALEDADAIVHHIIGYGLTKDLTDPLERRLAAIAATQESDAPDIGPETSDRIAVRVLFVGGDEGDARQDSAIKESLFAADPHIAVTFIRPGWSGHWAGTLDEVKRCLPSHDAVVVSRFIRTELGRQVRRAIRTPSRGCGGTGRRAVTSSIQLAAADARRRMSERLESGGSEATARV